MLFSIVPLPTILLHLQRIFVWSSLFRKIHWLLHNICLSSWQVKKKVTSSYIFTFRIYSHLFIFIFRFSLKNSNSALVHLRTKRLIGLRCCDRFSFVPPSHPPFLPSFPLLSHVFLLSFPFFYPSFFFFLTYHPAWRLEDEKMFILKCHLESSHYYNIGYMKREHRLSSKATFNSLIQHHSKMINILINQLRTRKKRKLSSCVRDAISQGNPVTFLLVKWTVWHLFRISIH